MKKLKLFFSLILLPMPFLGICQIATFDTSTHKVPVSEKIIVTIKYDSLRPISRYPIGEDEYARGVIGQQLYYPKGIKAEFFLDKQKTYASSELPLEKPLTINSIIKGSNPNYSTFVFELVDETTKNIYFTSDIGISLGFYEKTRHLHEGKKFRVKNRVEDLKDFVTGKLINISDCGTLFTCKQIALHNGTIIAVLENEKGTITQSIGNSLVIIKDNIPYIYDDNKGFAYRRLLTDLDAFKSKIEPTKLPERIADIIGEDIYKTFEAQKYIDNFGLYMAKVETLVSAEKKKAQAVKDQEYAALKQKIANDDKKRLENCIAKYGSQYGSMVAKREVAIGMDKDMCKTAWGSPNRVQKEQQSGSTVETWIYTNIFSFDIKYIVFVNDKVQEFLK